MQAAKLFAHIEQKYFLVSTTTYKLGVMAWIRSLFVAFLSCVVVLVLATDLQGRIDFNDVCPGIGQLGHSQVSLDNGRMKGSIMRDGTFTIPDVPAGTYVLSVVSPHYSFDQLRIDVLDSETTLEVRPYVAGTPLNAPSTILLSYPITMVPRQKHVYFMPPDSFNLMAMFSNPMMLLMVFGGIMVFAMPYIMKNLDPEALEEMKGQYAKAGKLQNAVTSGVSKSEISPADAEEPSSPSIPHSAGKIPSSTRPKGTNRNKKR